VIVTVTATMLGALGVRRAWHRVSDFDESYAAIPSAAREHIDEHAPLSHYGTNNFMFVNWSETKNKCDQLAVQAVFDLAEKIVGFSNTRAMGRLNVESKSISLPHPH
jgi:hypothetical protein